MKRQVFTPEETRAIEEWLAYNTPTQCPPFMPEPPPPAPPPAEPTLEQRVAALAPTHTLPQIAELIGMPYSKLARLCKRNGITPVKSKHGEARAVAERLVASGASYKRAGEISGRPEHEVKKWMES